MNTRLERVVDTLGELAPKFIGTNEYANGEGGVVKFNETYIHPQNGQVYPCCAFPKREATLMAMSYSPAISAAVYDRMTELEEQVVSVLGEDLAEKFSSASQYKSGKGVVQERLIYIFPKREDTSAKFYAHVDMQTLGEEASAKF